MVSEPELQAHTHINDTAHKPSLFSNSPIPTVERIWKMVATSLSRHHKHGLNRQNTVRGERD
jgi:hypothetical protein